MTARRCPCSWPCRRGVKGFTRSTPSARQALTRLRFVCQLADTSSEVRMAAVNSLVSEAVDVVVHCARVCVVAPGHREGRPASSQPAVE